MKDSGVPHPAHVAQPALRSEDVDIYDAFCLLSAGRMWNEIGPQPIQTNEIKSHLEIDGPLDPEECSKWYRIIRRMDGADINFRQQQLTKARKK